MSEVDDALAKNNMFFQGTNITVERSVVASNVGKLCVVVI